LVYKDNGKDAREGNRTPEGTKPWDVFGENPQNPKAYSPLKSHAFDRFATLAYPLRPEIVI
tara:strand:- start:548 stop:730 length:183 start_codon:yes stop_codon:yes gene_type:complete